MRTLVGRAIGAKPSAGAKGCDQLPDNCKTSSRGSPAMRICGVEEADMTNEGSVCAAYAYLAYVETNLGELGEEDPPLSPPPPLSGDRAAASLNLHRPSPLLSSTDSARRPRWKLLLRGDLSWQASPRGTRLDFLSRLPPEIAVYILRFLHPKYLCSVVQVSPRWRWLAQYGCLRARRMRYIQRKREKYLQAKENRFPGHRHTATHTPHTITRNSLTDCASSPLTSIQSSRQRHSRQTWLHTPYSGSFHEGETPVQLPRYGRSLRRSARRQEAGSPVLATPENAYHRLYRGTEEDPGYVVRRCLFPHSPSLSQAQPRHLPTVPPDDDSSTTTDANFSVKKSASKRRLKRL